MKRRFKLFLPLLMITLAATGCSFGSGGNNKEGEQSTLRVLFAALNPNVEVEVVSTQSMYAGGEIIDYNKALYDFIDKEKPDIVMLSPDQYTKLGQEGKLYELDAVMEKEKYDTEGLVPGMLDYLRELGGGKVYGMTPTFSSQVLMYNKDLFDKYQIPYPTDKMSWNEVIQTARLFPTDGDAKERVYGLKVGYSENLFEMASMLAMSEGVNYVNAAQKLMTINSETWKNAFQTSLDALNSDALYFESRNQGNMDGATTYEDYIMRDPFISGRLAMTIGETGVIEQIKQAKQNEQVKDKVISNWDMVTVPVGQQNPDQSPMMNFYNLFAISADSPNKDVAWDFIEYFTSRDYGKVKVKARNYGGFPVRTEFIKGEEGRHYEAFYMLKPTVNNMYSNYEKLPQNFWGEFNMLMEEEMKKVQDGSAELDATIELLQIKGQELLDKAPEPEAEGAGTGTVESGAAGAEAGAVESESSAVIETKPAE
jgi:multiple sugar transport system substrate-binding protein